MDNNTKAKINGIVKKVKKSRAESAKHANDPKTATFAYQVSSRPEKAMIGLGLAAALAIIFDGAKKRKKHPEKAKPFYKRVIGFYKMLGGVLDSTVAQQLKIDAERTFKDEKLERMEIENAIKFKL